MQQALVILIVSACGVWLVLQMVRYVRPKAGGKACAGGCCDGGEKKPALGAAGASPTPRGTLMISSDDLRARIQARKK